MERYGELKALAKDIVQLQVEAELMELMGVVSYLALAFDEVMQEVKRGLERGKIEEMEKEDRGDGEGK